MCDTIHSQIQARSYGVTLQPQLIEKMLFLEAASPRLDQLVNFLHTYLTLLFPNYISLHASYA